MNQPLIAAVVQHAPVFMNLEASLDRACSLVEQAAQQGAHLIAFPETWLPGYPVWLDVAPGAALWDHAPAKELYRHLVDQSLTIPGPHLGRLLDVAHGTGSSLVMGAHERLGGTLYNTMVYVHPDGKRYELHRKLMPTYTERLLWGRGDGSTLGAWDTSLGRVGGLICWEHWMPLARAAMHSHQEEVHVAQWPYVKELHHIASRHYAFEGQCFVLAAGSVLRKGEALEGLRLSEPAGSGAEELLDSMPGSDDGWLLRGGSAIIAPDTSYLAGPVYEEACTLYAELNPALIDEGRMALDTDGHYARPDVFRLEVDDRPQASVSFRSRRRESE